MPEPAVTAAFARLHEATHGFIMPNVWDVGSALIVAEAGYSAIATTSAGIAFSLGKQDYGVTEPRLAVTREEMLRRAAEIASAVRMPVNVDLEAGYGDSPEAVAATVRAAVEAGLAGGNIEDRMPLEPKLYDEGLAVERIVAAREAIDAVDRRFVLTARCDAIVWEGGLADAIRRSNRYREAGADCLFTPGVSDLPSISRLVQEVDGPMNFVLGLGNAEGNPWEWIEAGVQRVSLGGSLARAVYGLVHRSALELARTGSIAFAGLQMPQSELNGLFARRSTRIARAETDYGSNPGDPAPLVD